jgi:hypothetical protein
VSSAEAYGSPVPASVSVAPAASDIPTVGQTQSFTATAIFADGSSRVLDANRRTWKVGPFMPIPPSSLMAAAINGKMYAAGGYNAGVKHILQSYDPTTGG